MNKTTSKSRIDTHLGPVPPLRAESLRLLTIAIGEEDDRDGTWLVTVDGTAVESGRLIGLPSVILSVVRAANADLVAVHDGVLVCECTQDGDCAFAAGVALGSAQGLGLPVVDPAFVYPSGPDRGWIERTTDRALAVAKHVHAALEEGHEVRWLPAA